MFKLNLLEKLVCEIDAALRTLFPPQLDHLSISTEESLKPTVGPNSSLDYPSEKKSQIAALMRVNHSGEVCAQALYRGQALAAQNYQIKKQLKQAAHDEEQHLDWCSRHLQVLNSRTSLLNPVWYCGSWIIGIVIASYGDIYSLAFVVETEKQVAEHLQKHLKQIPSWAIDTRNILEKMHQDELSHANEAQLAGAGELPLIIKKIMRWTAKVMTTCSYYV